MSVETSLPHSKFHAALLALAVVSTMLTACRSTGPAAVEQARELPALDPHVRGLLFDPRDAKDPSIASLFGPALVPAAPATAAPNTKLSPEKPGRHPATPLPLTGVTVALDPGHMGGSAWDERTGKYIIDEKGNRLSEGEMALELSLLVERRLKALGARVVISRRSFAPVTRVPFKNDPESSRAFLAEDLRARGEVLLAARPDLAIILHFDESTPADDHFVSHLPHRCNDTKAYVAGAFSKDELQAPEDRALFQTLARAPSVWDNSVKLSSDLVNEISTTAGSPLAKDTVGKSVPVAPGVFSRNLRVSRELAGVVSSYVEVLCYEDPAQLAALLPHDHSIVIAGKKEFYSNRLRDLSEAIARGVLNYEGKARSPGPSTTN